MVWLIAFMLFFLMQPLKKFIDLDRMLQNVWNILMILLFMQSPARKKYSLISCTTVNSSVNSFHLCAKL